MVDMIVIDKGQLRCLDIRGNLHLKFSALHTEMVITLDQENKVWHTAQTINNILKSKRNGSFVTIWKLQPLEFKFRKVPV